MGAYLNAIRYFIDDDRIKPCPYRTGSLARLIVSVFFRRKLVLIVRRFKCT